VYGDGDQWENFFLYISLKVHTNVAVQFHVLRVIRKVRVYVKSQQSEVGCSNSSLVILRNLLKLN
jgi:hypothetical protein